MNGQEGEKNIEWVQINITREQIEAATTFTPEKPSYGFIPRCENNQKLPFVVSLTCENDQKYINAHVFDEKLKKKNFQFRLDNIYLPLAEDPITPSVNTIIISH